MDFYRHWVIPLAGIVWFGVAVALCFVFLPLGILALVVAAVLFEGLLRERTTKQASAGSDQQAAK